MFLFINNSENKLYHDLVARIFFKEWRRDKNAGFYYLLRNFVNFTIIINHKNIKIFSTCRLFASIMCYL
jgi:hypothetical protein